MTALPMPGSRAVLAPLLRYTLALGIRGVETVGKLGLYVLAARTLGAHDAGLFFLCLTWIGLASTMARMGLDRAVTRHVAAELAVGDVTRARHALRSGLLWSTVGGVAAAALTAALAGPADEMLFGQAGLAAPLTVSAVVIIPQTMALMAGAVLAGLKRGLVAQLVQNALWPVLTLAGMLLGAVQLEPLLMVMGAALAVSAIGGFLVIAWEWRRLPGRRAGCDPAVTIPAPAHLPHLWRTALPLLVVEVVQVTLASAPVLALGMVAEAGAVGAFSVASRISMLVWVVIISVGTLVAPQFAEHHRRGEHDRLHALNRSARRAVALFGVPLVLLMMALPGTLLDMVGAGFDLAAGALVILAAGQLVNCLLPCQDVLLAMTGHGRVLGRLNLLQLGTCAVLAPVLIPALGMTGAAIVAALCVAQGAIGTTIVARFVLR
ncbi:oligosaccharide flippase family protein [Arenibaculum pallidiluteum]|uniref:oligosaccharide flippase family protein n=1 Tax=Arenibaculum pallidiluteum TaxID=2812559 RepID=UPI001F3B387A|nr:oligosaccharide flippase family protein [Arenibaculum pallidiluteum]